MSRLVVFFFVLIQCLQVWGLELEYLNSFVIPEKLNFKKTTVGGLSGLAFDGESLFAVSDDRGGINEPRIYKLKAEVSLKEFKVELQDVIFLTVNEGPLAHKSTKSKAQIFSKVIDLEGLSLTPWGDFLLANEGDANKKPRIPPQILNVKKEGIIVRDFSVPASFIPNPTGEQKTGVQNNLAFEGLAQNPNGQEWIVATEGPLIQDPKSFVRFLVYQMPEAWVLKPGKEFKYPLRDGNGKPFEFRGISEIHFFNENELLVLERSARLGPQGIQISVQIFKTNLAMAGKDRLLPKAKVLDLAELGDKIGKIENFEGMTLGPKLSDGRKSLILVSDDNFMRSQRTQFLLFAIKE